MARHQRLQLACCVLLLVAVVAPWLTCALSCRSVAAGGDWHLNSTWTGCGGGLPGPDDVATIGGSSQQADVTIASGSAPVQVAAVLVNSGRLLNKGELRAAYVLVETAALLSTGKLAVAGNATLIVDSGVLTHSGSLSLNASAETNGSAYLRVSSSRVAIDGSLSVLSTASGYARAIVASSRVTVGGRLTITGGFSSDAATVDSDLLNELASGLGAESSAIIVKGDVSITSHYGQSEIGGGATGNVALWAQGTDLTVGDELAVQSADAGAGANSGFVELATAQDVDQPSGSGPVSVSNIIVGGVVFVESGDGGSADGGQGGSAGGVVLGLYNSVLAAKGKVASIVVQGGNGGFGSDGGGAGADAKVVVAYGGTVKVSGELALTGGQGGLGGGLGGSALLSVQHGGQIDVGTDAVLMSGDGGDGHPNSTDGGNGGVSGLLIVEAGSVTVKRDAVFTSGRGGNGNQGGSSRTSYLAAAPVSDIRKRATTTSAHKSSLSVAIGGDLRLVSRPAGNGSTYGGGGSCIAARTTSLTGDVGGIVLDVYGARLAVAGDISIGGCSGGQGFGVRGGSAGVTAITSLGGSIGVGGSVSVTGGDGGLSVNSTNDGGQGAIAFLAADTDSSIDIQGSLTLASGRGGDVVNGTGNGGDVAASSNSQDLFAGVSLHGSSSVTVAGLVSVTSGPSGSVSAGSVEGAAGRAGSPATMSIVADDSSAFTAGDVSLVGGDTGFAITNVAGEEPATDDEADLVNPTAVGASGRGVITINGKLYVKGGNGGSENLRRARDAGSAQVAVTSFGRAILRGTATVLGGDGGNSASASDNGGNGGIGLLYARSEGQLTFGDLVLRGGAAGQGAQISLDGERGPALATATYGAAVFQSGRLSLRAGDARNASVSASTRYPPHSIALTAAEWTVYPCSGAGISFAADPANSFALALSSTFRDCRGSGASVGYPTPVSDGSGDASCVPCSCTESAYSSCPSSAASSVLPPLPLAFIFSFLF
ncbi:uncharacterized protein ACA1_244890 [Acanthamoeba castellanii str. Neff]|uniref:Uncharacterized protein n=1 Tax=Acanthamoeba castellanii (strain ATCC 30010 / Neff) TaxID=1257118 RepID=L8GKR8_ACACF|nr:uncharacterized protein ACA1_244890 [Acanthamoeba castellanii str. Neff]ELR13439.1 hypothetical protein ACA1_244890 [Acanthamoeba castellanii str. Neff]